MPPHPGHAEDMKVSLLYFDGCPNWLEADERLQHALDALGRSDVEIERIEISTPEEAEAAQFCGSPTILVDGSDPFAERPLQVGLSCRIYRTEHGPAGSPTVEQLLDVLS